MEFITTKSHNGYINTLSIDVDFQRYLLCGGSDSAISLFDVDKKTQLAKVNPKQVHNFVITKISWWPFNNDMFLSSSLDQTVKVWDAEQFDVVYSFDFENKVYCFDINNKNEYGLVAVGLNSSLIRLIDLRTAGHQQSFKGHQSGSVLSTKFCPFNEFVLASAGSDGTVRLFDIRQANQQLACLDMDKHKLEMTETPIEFRKSHRAIANGLAWHPSSKELLSLGLDNKVRIWEVQTDFNYANTNRNFGPLFRNRRQLNLDPAISLVKTEDDIYVMVPSDTGDVLMCQWSDGRLVKRLTPIGESRMDMQGCIISRYGTGLDFFSGTSDGSVIYWSLDK